MTFFPFASMTLIDSGSAVGQPSATIFPWLIATSAATKPAGVHTSPFFTTRSTRSIRLLSPFEKSSRNLYMIHVYPCQQSVKKPAPAAYARNLTPLGEFESIHSDLV